jgi:hypothetical protein
MIGSANWVITLGRLDITYATNTVAKYSMAPREGHLIALKRLFGYLRKHPDGQILRRPIDGVCVRRMMRDDVPCLPIRIFRLARGI